MNPKAQGATFIKGFPVTHHACYGYSEVEVRLIIEMRPIIKNLQSPTQNFHIGHVQFMLFVLISLGNEHEPSLQWNMGLRPTREVLSGLDFCGPLLCD